MCDLFCYQTWIDKVECEGVKESMNGWIYIKTFVCIKHHRKGTDDEEKWWVIQSSILWISFPQLYHVIIMSASLLNLDFFLWKKNKMSGERKKESSTFELASFFIFIHWLFNTSWKLSSSFQRAWVGSNSGDEEVLVLGRSGQRVSRSGKSSVERIVNCSSKKLLYLMPSNC